MSDTMREPASPTRASGDACTDHTGEEEAHAHAPAVAEGSTPAPLRPEGGSPAAAGVDDEASPPPEAAAAAAADDELASAGLAAQSDDDEAEPDEGLPPVEEEEEGSHLPVADGPAEDDAPASEASDDAAELPDNARSDVRAAASEPVTYEALHAEENSPAGDAAGASSASEEAQIMANPSEGVQVDAERDLAADAEDGAGSDGSHAQLAPLVEHDVDEAEVEASSTRLGVEPVADTPSPAVQGSSTNAPVQTAAGTVVITATILPMECRAVLTLPVLRAVKGASNPTGSHSQGTRPAQPAEGCWLLSGRGLYEAIAAKLCVHPQDFRILRRSERVRFSSMIELDVDRTKVHAGTGSGLGAPVSSVEETAGSPERAAQYVSFAEPLWVSVVFPPYEGTDADGAAAADEEESNADGTQTAVPAYLAVLARGDVLTRCVRVRREKLDLAPRTLVEGRREGLSFDEVIRQTYAQDREGAMVTVAITAAPGSTHKAFLGGYRVKEDPARLLLHASTQLYAKGLNYSPFAQKANAVADTVSRQTQTLGTARSCQTSRECCVQTPCWDDRGPLVLSTAHDYVVTARPYFTAEQLHDLRVAKVVVLQKLYRVWNARRIRDRLEASEKEKQQRAAARQLAEEAALRARVDREHTRRADPRTAADFTRLRDSIVRWRATEAASVMAADVSVYGSEAQRQAVLLALTQEEVRLLQEVEHRRRVTLVARKEQLFDTRLARAAADKVWGHTGVAVTTPETARAGELRDLYRSLVEPRSYRDEADIADRLDLLLHVKWTVKEFPDAAVTVELCQLIDREADLLHRGRREASMSGLRERIASLFQRFIEDPAFNPGIAAFTNTAVGRAKARALGLDGSGRGTKSAGATASSETRTRSAAASTYSAAPAHVEKPSSASGLPVTTSMKRATASDTAFPRGTYGAGGAHGSTAEQRSLALGDGMNLAPQATASALSTRAKGGAGRHSHGPADAASASAAAQV